MSIFLFFY